MTLQDFLKLKSLYPKDTQVAFVLPDGKQTTSFDIEFKFTSEGKWVMVIKPILKV